MTNQINRNYFQLGRRKKFQTSKQSTKVRNENSVAVIFFPLALSGGGLMHFKTKCFKFKLHQHTVKYEPVAFNLVF